METAKLKFADFELDVAGYELNRRGRSIKLERIPMELLLLLVDRRGQIVTRDEIVEKLWGKDVFLDVTNGINTAISKIRVALKDDPEEPAFIKTISGKGYRFIALVTVSPDGTEASPRSPAAPSGRVMLAVLPFENLSNDPEQEYFSDGLTEETISRLGQMNPERMGVIARTSSMAYKRSGKSIAQIGSELSVDYVLESSVRRENNKVRISSQLIRVKDQTHLWAASYDREGLAVLQVQDELGRAIADEVRIKLSPQASRTHRTQPQDAATYDLYLRGRYHWNRLTPTELQRGIQYFEKAIERDPDYALAHAGLADCYAMFPIITECPALEILSAAMSAATRSVDLDEFSTEGYAAIGGLKMWIEWDWKGSERALRRAIELNPSYVTAHRWYGHLLCDIGRHEESAEEMKKAREVDPLSPIMHALSSHLAYLARNYEEALCHARTALALNPHLWIIHNFLGRILERMGQLDQALSAFQNAFDLSGGNTEVMSLRGYVYAEQGKRPEAEEVVRVLLGLSEHKYVPPYNIAMVYAGLGEIEIAIRWLEKAFETRDVRLTLLATEPKWDNMRSRPKFQDLLRRLGLPLIINP